jgi:uncharacterized protein YcbK (DUF882 family)
MPRRTAIFIAVGLLALSHVPPALGNGRGAPSTSRACLPAALKNMLASIETRYGRVRVISTHRPGARIAGTRYASLHATCRAVDFHPAPGSYRQVLAYARANWKGGIGTYSGKSHHIHLDVGFAKYWHTHIAGSSGRAGGWPRKAAAQGEFSSASH